MLANYTYICQNLLAWKFQGTYLAKYGGRRANIIDLFSLSRLPLAASVTVWQFMRQVWPPCGREWAEALVHSKYARWVVNFLLALASSNLWEGHIGPFESCLNLRKNKENGEKILVDQFSKASWNDLFSSFLNLPLHL